MDSLKKSSNTTLITFKYLGEIENVNKTENNTGATGLMFAAMNGNVELIKTLIGFGAELDAKDTVYGMENIVFLSGNVLLLTQLFS